MGSRRAVGGLVVCGRRERAVLDRPTSFITEGDFGPVVIQEWLLSAKPTPAGLQAAWDQGRGRRCSRTHGSQAPDTQRTRFQPFGAEMT